MDYFDPKDPAEIIPLTFDFQHLIPKTDAIVGSPVVACSLFSGNDTGQPTAVLSGGATVSGNSVKQNAKAGVAGAYYLIHVTVTTVAGYKFTIGKVLPVKVSGTY